MLSLEQKKFALKKWFITHSITSARKRKVSVSTLRMSVTVRLSSSFHILTSFAKVDADIREDIISLLLLRNDVASVEALVADNVTLKSCSIDEMFV